MIIGAGSSGQMIVHDIHRSNKIHDKVCCFIDDNSNKWNRYIDGVKVVGGREEILASVKKYHVDKIYLAIPSASAMHCMVEAVPRNVQAPADGHPVSL